MVESVVIKPLKFVFLWRPVLITALILGVVFGFVALLAIFMDFGVGIALGAMGLYFGLVIYTFFDQSAAYGKTSLEVQEDRVLFHTGGLFSDNTINLPFRNVTQLEMKLPFLEYKLFKTGHLKVHAAGSVTSTVEINSIEHAEELYSLLEDRLEDNGFRLYRDQPLIQEKPGFVGVIADTLGGSSTSLSGLFAVAFLAIVLGPAAVTFLFEIGAGAFGAALSFSVFTFIVVAFGITFVDLMQRTYTLFQGMVLYEDGFLTQRRKLIPIANLADTNIVSPMIKRVCGLSDMVVSCQGAAGNISLPSLPNAARFRNRLDELIATTDQPAELEEPNIPQGEGVAPNGQSHREPGPGERAAAQLAPPKIVAAQAPVKQYKLHPMRNALSGLLAVVGGAFVLTLGGVYYMYPGPALAMGLLILVCGSLATLAKTAFAYFTISYTLGNNSVVWVQDVLANRKQVEFTNDKITKIIVTRSPFDRLVNTLTVEFHSIGSLTPVVFRHLPDHEEIFRELHRRFALPAEKPNRIFTPEVSIGAVLANKVIGIAVTFVLAIFLGALVFYATESVYFGLAALVGVSFFPVGSICYDLAHGPKCSLQLYTHHVMAKAGIWIHTYTYVAYHHARNVCSFTYPGQEIGTVIIDAGGAGAKASIEYLPTPYSVHNEVDEILYRHPMKNVRQNDSFETDEIQSWKPVATNGLIGNSITAVIFVVGIPLLPVVLYLTNMYFRLAKCSLQQDRVCQWRGIFFKRFSTVLINRIDQLQTRRGFLNNMLKNGMVEVFTVGSGHAELRLGPHEDFQDLYEAIDGIRKR